MATSALLSTQARSGEVSFASFFPFPSRLPIDRTAQFYLPFLVESAVPNPALKPISNVKHFRKAFWQRPSLSELLKKPICLKPATEDSKLSPPCSPLRKSRKRKPPAKATVPVDNKLLVSREEAAAMLSSASAAWITTLLLSASRPERIANRFYSNRGNPQVRTFRPSRADGWLITPKFQFYKLRRKFRWLFSPLRVQDSHRIHLLAMAEMRISYG